MNKLKKCRYCRFKNIDPHKRSYDVWWCKNYKKVQGCTPDEGCDKFKLTDELKEVIR
jgi:hypothetical protein